MKILEQKSDNKRKTYTYKLQLSPREKELLKQNDALPFFLELLELEMKFFKNDFGFSQTFYKNISSDIEITFNELEQLNYFLPNRMFDVECFDYENGGKQLGLLVTTDELLENDYLNNLFFIGEPEKIKLSNIQTLALKLAENKGYKLSTLQSTEEKAITKLEYDYKLDNKLTTIHNKNIYTCTIYLTSITPNSDIKEVTKVSTILLEEGFMFNNLFENTEDPIEDL